MACVWDHSALYYAGLAVMLSPKGFVTWVTVTKCENKMKKGLFWLPLSNNSFNGYLALLLWDLL